MSSGYWQDFALHLSQECPTLWTMPSAVITITSYTAVRRHTQTEDVGVLVGISNNQIGFTEKERQKSLPVWVCTGLVYVKDNLDSTIYWEKLCERLVLVQVPAVIPN